MHFAYCQSDLSALQPPTVPGLQTNIYSPIVVWCQETVSIVFPSSIVNCGLSQDRATTTMELAVHTVKLHRFHIHVQPVHISCLTSSSLWASFLITCFPLSLQAPSCSSYEQFQARHKRLYNWSEHPDACLFSFGFYTTVRIRLGSFDIFFFFMQETLS